MSKFLDDSLGTVVNTEGGGSRASTPQMKRTQSRRQRQTTPQRAGSAPRSSSANKASALAKACFESQSCNRSLSRTAGRKKQQRWENDNLFGLNMFMKRIDALNKNLYDADGETEYADDNMSMRQGMSVNWQSLFGTLTNGEHADALEAYLMCSNSYCTLRDNRQSKSIRDCVSEWDRAEFSWRKVEKRLRTILLRALINGRKEMEDFIASIEGILLGFENNDMDSIVPTKSTEHLFPSAPRFSKKSSRTQCKRELIVSLLDSPFHRLLLHATCQFHNMHSKSYADKANDGRRITSITSFQSQKCRHSISLVPFLLLKLSEEKDAPTLQSKDKENLSGNSLGRGSDKLEQETLSNVVSLENISLEEKETEVNTGDDDNKSEVSYGSASDDEEYCLVSIMKPSDVDITNPIESREN